MSFCVRKRLNAFAKKKKKKIRSGQSALFAQTDLGRDCLL